MRKETCSGETTAVFSRCEHTWILLRAQTDMLMRQHCCIRTLWAHWISLRAQRDMFRRKNCSVLTLGAQLDLSPCARRPVHATTLLRSHAVSTLGSHSVRKEACSDKKTAAFSRREHTWISLRAQRDMFHRKGRCVLTRRPDWDISPCASNQTCSCDRLLRSHATSTLRSLSVRKETRSGKTAASFSRCEHTWISLRAQRDMFHRKDCCDHALPPRIDDFYLRRPDPVSTVKRVHVPYAIGYREPVTRNPSHRAFALQTVDPRNENASKIRAHTSRSMSLCTSTGPGILSPGSCLRFDDPPLWSCTSGLQRKTPLMQTFPPLLELHGAIKWHSDLQRMGSCGPKGPSSQI